MRKTGNPHVSQIRKRLRRPLVLTGMMGSGKSHLGRALAGALDLPFVDSDTVIEEQAGCTVTEIFARDGEEKFRRAEKRAVLEILGGGVRVIALGGGAVMTPEIAAAVNAQALSLWIRADAEELWRRLEQAGDRPLLACENPRAKLEHLLKQREDAYNRADIVLEGVPGSLPQTLDKALALIAGHLEQENG